MEHPGAVASRRVFVRSLLPGAAGLVIPVRSELVRPQPLTPIPYSDLPTGSGSWDAGSGATTTITRALTVSGLLTASAGWVSNADNSIVSTLPRLFWNDSDGTTNKRRVDLTFDSQFNFEARNDAGSFLRYLLRLDHDGPVSVPGTLTATGLLTAQTKAYITGDADVLTLKGASNADAYIHFRRSTDDASLGKWGRLDSGQNNMGVDLGDTAADFSVRFGGTKYLKLTTAALSPNTSGGLTLGTASVPWGNLYVSTKVDFRSASTRWCGWEATAADTLRWFDSGGTNRLEVKYQDGFPRIGPVDNGQQMAVGDKANGGYILFNGTNYGSENGDVLITGRSNVSNPAAPGDVQIRSYDGTNAPYVNATFKAGGEVNIARSGLTVGSPTGGDKGTGKINVAGDIYKNNTAYTNPDYVFETAYEGVPRSPAPEGYRVRSLAEVEQFTKEHFHLPSISRKASGMFARADMLLEKVEELYLHAFAQQREMNDLKSRIQVLEFQLQRA